MTPQELLHVGLGAFDLGAISAGTEHQHTLSAKLVGLTIDQIVLRSDDDQINVALGHQLFDGLIGRTRDEWVPGRNHHFDGPTQRDRKPMLAATFSLDYNGHLTPLPGFEELESHGVRNIPYIMV